MNDQRSAWPTKELIYFLIVIFLVQFLITAIIGDVASEIRSGYEMMIYAILDLLFIARLVKAKIKHEENTNGKVYVAVLGISTIFTPIIIHVLERLLI